MAAERPIRMTGKEYAAFDDAYDWFNHRLFEGRVPPCLITLQRKARSHGYVANSRFGHGVEATAVTDELARNPDTFGTRSDTAILFRWADKNQLSLIACDEGFSCDDLLHEFAILEAKALGDVKHGREGGAHAP